MNPVFFGIYAQGFLIRFLHYTLRLDDLRCTFGVFLGKP